MLHVSRNTVINWEADKCKPEYNYIPQICSILGLQLHELFSTAPITGLSTLEGRVVENLRLLSPLHQRVVDKAVQIMVEEECAERDAQTKAHFMLFPVRPGMVAAGTGAYVPEAAPTFVFIRKNTVNTKADGIVKVHGDSMEPVYHDGDYVYYKKADAASPGNDVIVDTFEGAVIKRMKDDHTLYSVNPDFPYPVRNEEDELQIRGIVLGIVDSSEKAAPEEAATLELLFADEIRAFNEKYRIYEG